MENSKNMGGLGSVFGHKGNVFSYPVAIKQQHNIYITGPIREVEEHIDRIETIRTAPAGDVVRIIINTPGGHVTTMLSYMQAIKESKAEVICHAEGQVASAGTFIWLSGHQHSIADYTEFMFHNMQYGAGGDAANVQKQVTFYSDWGRELRESVYKDFLTQDEMTIIANAGEVYLNAKEVLERMPAYYEARKVEEPCNCEECQVIAEAQKVGYFSLQLKTGKIFRVPVEGSLTEDMLEEFDIEEWREAAEKLQVDILKKDSKKRIMKKIDDQLKKDMEELEKQ